MCVKVETVWGSETFPEEILNLPEEHYRDLLRKEEYSDKVLKLMRLRDALLDGLNVIPPEKVEKFVSVMRKIKLI